jgi:hypothetical protein
LTGSKWKYRLRQGYSTTDLITSAPSAVISASVGVAGYVFDTVPQLPSFIGRTIVSAARQVQSQMLPT